MMSQNFCKSCGGTGRSHTEPTGTCLVCGALIRFGSYGAIETIEISGKNPAEVSRVALDLVSHLDSRSASRQPNEIQLEKNMDPISIISAIAAALGLVDKFVTVVGKLRSQDPKPFSVETKKEADALVIRSMGTVVETVTPAQLHMNEFDEVRFEALKKSVSSLWNQFNGLYGELPNLGIDEQVRVRGRMEQMRKDLCRDFREMIEISEKVLGIPLADHYTLHRTCGE